MDISVHVFDANGQHLAKVPCKPPKWAQTISAAGSMTIDIPDSRELRMLPLESILGEYKSIWTVIINGRIRHAGWLTHYKSQDNALTLDIGGGWSIWQKRVVARYDLVSRWQDGDVLIDEQNPPGDWILSLQGTYSDIARGLLAESMRFGRLPYSLPTVQGGSEHVRNYDVWDFTPVSQRLTDLSNLEDGPEIRFDPHLTGDSMTFSLTVGAPEIIDHHWQWSLGRQSDHVQVTALDIDGADLTCQVFGTGGRKQDNLLVAMASSQYLSDRGWPWLQSANTSHSSVSELWTLQNYLRGDLVAGACQQTTVGLQCSIELDIHVGDWIDLRVSHDPLQHESLSSFILRQIASQDSVLALKVVGINADCDLDYQTVQVRVRQ